MGLYLMISVTKNTCGNGMGSMISVTKNTCGNGMGSMISVTKNTCGNGMGSILVTRIAFSILRKPAATPIEATEPIAIDEA
jgi:hypothetical protein